MLRRFQHQEGADAAGGDALMGAGAGEDRPPLVLEQQFGEVEIQDQVLALGRKGAADEADLALPGGDPGLGRIQRRDARGLLAHEGA